jgi:hypothetical protein
MTRRALDQRKRGQFSHRYFAYPPQATLRLSPSPKEPRLRLDDATLENDSFVRRKIVPENKGKGEPSLAYLESWSGRMVHSIRNIFAC